MVREWGHKLAGSSRALIWVLALVSAQSGAAGAEERLHGTVVESGTGEPIRQVRVVLDNASVWMSLEDGSFQFGPMTPGPHVLVFEHIAYKRREISLQWPGVAQPLVVELEPAEFLVGAIEVTAKREVPSLPVSTVSFDREDMTVTAGNIASDPLRTVQSHPSAASAGIDFLSAMAIRGGNTEEHRVYFDGFPLRHYAHVGGFASVVYDDMLESALLLPGAAPIRYKGTLSGVVMLNPETPDTSSLSLRYDITSIAGGIEHVAGPRARFQVSAKSDFFNLPVYQQVGVEKRSFKDLLARGVLQPNDAWTVTPMVLLARDSELGAPVGGVSQERETNSALVGVHVRYTPADWEITLRPYFSYFKSRDGLTWSAEARRHELTEGGLFAEVSRQRNVLGVALSGQVGAIQHSGTGGDMNDVPFAGSAELRLMYHDTAAMILGVGGSREEWTSTFEPEAYGSVRLGVGEWLTLSGAYRRSHQTPFLFNERRYFASIPIDPGDLASNFTPSRGDAVAVRMDQTSVEARLELPLGASIEGNGFWRWYEDLLTWDWSDFPALRDVRNGGSGRGYGYEVVVARDDPGLLSVMVAASSARVWKTEGTLKEERVGDFDKPDAWQMGASVRLAQGLRLALRWTDVAGRPYTDYFLQTTPPPDDQVNAVRLERFRRLDVKLSYHIPSEYFQAVVFIDIVNFLNRKNIAATYALEVNPGEFVTVPYGGTQFFPIGGVTIRW